MQKTILKFEDIWRTQIIFKFLRRPQQKGFTAMSLESVADKALKEVGNKFQDIAWTTGIITLLLSPITVIGNGLVLASILLDPFKNIRRSPSSNLIFNLALTDFLMGLVTDPLAAVWHIYTASNSIELYSSKIMFILAIILVGVSTCSLVALSVDRRIAVTTPLQYAYRVTKRKIRIAIVLHLVPFHFRCNNMVIASALPILQVAS